MRTMDHLELLVLMLATFFAAYMGARALGYGATQEAACWLAAWAACRLNVRNQADRMKREQEDDPC